MGVRAREILDRYPVEDFERAWLRVLDAAAPTVAGGRWPTSGRAGSSATARCARRRRLRRGLAQALPSWLTLSR